MEDRHKLTQAEVCLAVRGLPAAIAEKIICGNGYYLRIVAEDGKSPTLTAEVARNRINVTIMAGVVVDAHNW